MKKHLLRLMLLVVTIMAGGDYVRADEWSIDFAALAEKTESGGVELTLSEDVVTIGKTDLCPCLMNGEALDSHFLLQSGTKWLVRKDPKGDIHGLYQFNSGARAMGMRNCIKGQIITIVGTGDPNPLSNATLRSKNDNTYTYTVTADGHVMFSPARYLYFSLVSVADPSQTTVNYTVKYVDQKGVEIKTASSHSAEPGSNAILLETDKAPIYANDTKYIYESDDAQDKAIADDGTTVITVTFREAEVFTYKWDAADRSTGIVIRNGIATGSAFEGEVVKFPYCKYILFNETLYKKDPTNSEYNYSFTITGNTYQPIWYGPTDITNVVYYSEGENITGMTPYVGNNTVIRSSNAATGISSEGRVTITSLPAGKYKIVSCVYINNKGEYTFTYSAGTNEVFNQTLNVEKGTNGTETTSDEFTLEEETTIYLEQNTTGKCGVDYVYIVKTGSIDSEPTVALTAPQMWYNQYFSSSKSYSLYFGQSYVNGSWLDVNTYYSIDGSAYQLYDSSGKNGDVYVSVGSTLSYYATLDGYQNSPVTTVTVTMPIYETMQELDFTSFMDEYGYALAVHDDGPMEGYRWLMNSDTGDILFGGRLATPNDNIDENFKVDGNYRGIVSAEERTYAVSGLTKGQVLMMMVGKNEAQGNPARSATPRQAQQKAPRRAISGGMHIMVTAIDGLELDEWNSDDQGWDFATYAFRVTKDGTAVFKVEGNRLFQNIRLYGEAPPETPGFDLIKIDGANRTYRVYNTATTLYYTTTLADARPAYGSTAYQSTTDAYADITISGVGFIHAYAENTAGRSYIAEQYVNGVELTLNAPYIDYKYQNGDQWEVGLTQYQYDVEGAPNATIYYKIGEGEATPYKSTLMIDNGATFSMWAQAEGYANSPVVTVTTSAMPELNTVWYESYTYKYTYADIVLGTEEETGLYTMTYSGNTVGDGRLLTPDENLDNSQLQMTSYYGLKSSVARTYAIQGLTAGQWLFVHHRNGTLSPVTPVQGLMLDGWNTESNIAKMKVTADGTVKFTVAANVYLQQIYLYNEREDGDVIVADANGNELKYHYENATSPATLTGVARYASDEDKAGRIIIADEVTDSKGNTHNVTAIKASWASDSNLKSIVFGNNIETIESSTSWYNSPFYNVYNLESVTLNSGLHTLPTYAFYNCTKLKTINLEAATSLTAIPEYSFQYCSSLEAVAIPASVTSIGQYAFSDCSAMTSISIPANVETLGGYAFNSCSKLASITFADESKITAIPEYCFQSCSALETLTLPKAVQTVGNQAFYYCSNLHELTFGTALAANGFAEDYYLFYYCSNMEKMTIPGVNFPFTRSYNSLPNSMMLFVHPDMVETYKNSDYTKKYHIIAIGSTTDYDVATTAGGQLATKVPADVAGNALYLKVTGFINGTDINYIHEMMPYLEELDLSAASIVEGGENYNEWRVSNNKPQKQSNNWPTANDVIGDRMFSYMPNLKKLSLPAGATTMGEYAIANNSKLTQVVMPTALTSIGYGAFASNQKLTAVDIPATVTAIGQYAFSSSAIKAAVIPTGVTRIEESTFSSCTSLESVTLHDGITYIGSSAFSSCSNLQSISIPAAVTEIGSSAFYYCQKLASAIVIPATCKTIGGSAFYNCNLLPSVTFSEGLETIGSSAFCNCSLLAEANLPASLQSLGSSAFQSTALTSFTFPANIKQVPSYVLSSCSALESVTLAEGTTAIRSQAFYNCQSLATVQNLNQQTLTELRSNCFYNTALTSVTLPNSITTMDNGVFQSCTKLVSANMPTGVTSVPSSTFRYCSSLTTVTMHDGITSINSNAFQNCSQLASIELNNNITRIYSNAFDGCTNLVLTQLPTALTDLYYYAFRNTKAITGNLTLPETLTYLGYNAFEGSGITGITITKVINNFGTSVFYNCKSLTSVSLPKEMTTIPSSTFQGTTALQTIELPENLTTIGSYAFYESGLTEITLPRTLTTIESCAFSYTKISTIEVPKSVTSVGSEFASYCQNLTSAYLGRSMNYGSNSNFDYFNGCNNITLLRVYAGTPPGIYYYYNGYRTNCVLEVPQGQVEAYQAANVWKDFKEIREFESPEMLNDADFAVMKKMYNLMDGENWTKKWDVSSKRHSNGKWNGVTTEVDPADDELFYITAIDLQGMGLNGKLPKELFALTKLQTIDLSHNTIEAKVDTLVADENTVITSVNMEGNHLTGDLYAFASKMPNLTSLNVSYNRLTDVSQAIPNTTLSSYNLSRGYQFVDYKTKLVDVPEDMAADVIIDVTPGETFDLPDNRFNTYYHYYGNWSITPSYLYRYVRYKSYWNNEYYFSTESEELYKDGDGNWGVYPYNNFKAPKGEPVVYCYTDNLSYIFRFNWKDGDVNGDQTVDVSDLQNVIHYALNDSKPVYEQMYNFTAADANGDNTINVSDIIGNVSYILSYEEQGAAPARVLYNKVKEDCRNSIDRSAGGLRLNNADEVAALQMTITGASKSQLSIAQDIRNRFSVSMREVDGGVRIVIYSAEGNTLTPGQTILMSTMPAGASVTDARLTDALAQPLGVSIDSTTTGIESLNIDMSNADSIFDLSGRRMGNWNTLPTGIYIIQMNGRQYKVRK